jgi:hypothetical protein
MALKDNVKPWFETGDYPTQAQFYQFFDNIWFKDEMLAIDNISGLQAILNSLSSGAAPQAAVLTADGYIEMPAACEVHKIILLAVVGGDSINIGTTPGGAEIATAVALTSNVKYRVINDFDLPINGRIYFTGINHSTQIIIYKD